MRTKYQSDPPLTPMKHEDLIALLKRYRHDVFNPQALARTGLGYEDIAYICDISKDDAKRIVWAAHSHGACKGVGRLEIPRQDADQDRSAQGDVLHGQEPDDDRSGGCGSVCSEQVER